MPLESEEIASEVFDRGRRGEPLLGCDCMQCFGYCLVDHEVARREISVRVDRPLPANSIEN